MISMTEKFIFLFVSSMLKNTCSNPDQSFLLDERKKTSRSFFIFSWRVSYSSNACTNIKKIPTATGGVLSGGILGRIQLANAIES
jgi:hypothetical protein